MSNAATCRAFGRTCSTTLMPSKLAGLWSGASSPRCSISRLTSAVIRTAEVKRSPPWTTRCPTARTSSREARAGDGPACKSSRIRAAASACFSSSSSSRISGWPARRKINRVGFLIQSIPPSANNASSSASKRLNLRLLDPALQTRILVFVSGMTLPR